MIVSALDIGSNTVKTTVFTYDKKQKSLTSSGHKTIPVGLIGYLKDGVINAEGINALIDAICDLADFAKSLGAEKIYPFATAAVRQAGNCEEILQKVAEATGYKIDLIPGEEEARLTFSAFLSVAGEDVRDGLVADMGGGSTELIAFKDRAVAEKVSLPIGALNLWVRHISGIHPTPAEEQALRDYVDMQYKTSGFTGTGSGKLYLNGGSGRSLVKLLSAIDGREHTLPYEISRERFQEIISLATGKDKAFQRLLIKVVPDSVHTLISAAIGLSEIADLVGYGSITVTEAGIREAYIQEKVKDL